MLIWPCLIALQGIFQQSVWRRLSNTVSKRFLALQYRTDQRCHERISEGVQTTPSSRKGLHRIATGFHASQETKWVWLNSWALCFWLILGKISSFQEISTRTNAIKRSSLWDMECSTTWTTFAGTWGVRFSTSAGSNSKKTSTTTWFA